MRASELRQRNLFDEGPLDARPVLPAQVLEQLRQLLTLWLRDVGDAMSREARDEQDRR